jgi:FkbM family methyltransferase
MVSKINQANQFLPESTKETLTGFLHFIFRPRIRRLFSQFVSPGDLVFDVGANVGHLTRVFLDLGARVVCVDPHPYCLEVLKKKFGKNKRITVVEKGLSSKGEKLSFFISAKNHATSTFSNKWKREGRFKNRAWNKTIDVEATTLEELIEAYGKPVFCKIDVEGFELRVLRGLRSPIPFLSFEFVEEFWDDAIECVRHLDSLGAVGFNYSLYNTYSFPSDEWLTSDQLFTALESKRGDHLCGDIYAHM